MTSTYSVYYTAQPYLALLGDKYHSSSGAHAVAKKAMTQLHKRTGQTRAKLYIRKHGSNDASVYSASSSKLKQPLIVNRNGSVFKIQRQTKSRYLNKINMPEV